MWDNRGIDLMELNMLTSMSRNDVLEHWIIAMGFSNVAIEIAILGSNI